jgi:phenylalanyl-tRNA synthetase beta chain
LLVQLTGKIAKYEAFSQYQQSQRDIALVLDEATPVAELIDSIKAMQQQNFVGVGLLFL